MKKSLLLCAAIAASMTAGAQEAPKAKLVDITPKGLDFSQYEPGYVFKVHASDGTAGWSPKAGLYNQETFDKDGYFAAFTCMGDATKNDTEFISGTMNKGITVQDFGGSLGKCLVFNQQWSPLATVTAGGSKLYGEGNPAWPAIGANPTTQYCLAFYLNPASHTKCWAGNAIRVRLVLDVVRRGCHAAGSGDYGINTAYGFSDYNNSGWYLPNTEWSDAIGDLIPEARVEIKSSEFGKWENEGTSLATMPAEIKLAATEKGIDPFDNPGHACAQVPMYYMQLDRFMVYEWDIYKTNPDQAVKININIPSRNSSIVIKEVKFYRIENAADLLVFPDPTNMEQFTYGPNSLLEKRAKSWRYYTPDGVKEIESIPRDGEQGGENPDQPVDKGNGTEEAPYLIYTPADLVAMRTQVSNANATYFKLMADLNMEGIDYIPAVGSNNDDFGKTIHFDGNNKVISNLKVSGAEVYYGSLFGVFQGSVKNLGLIDVNLNTGLGAAGIGGYAGYNNVATSIDNVFVTGNIECTSGYAGGIAGTNGADLTISNSYAQVNVKGSKFSGGLVGRGRANITISNCYVSGTVAGDGKNNLVASTDKTSGVTLKLNNVVALNSGATDMTNYGAMVTGEATTDQAAIATWAAFNQGFKLNELPALNWQGTAGVDAIMSDDNAPVEYFNLQGVRVENPTKGLYIKRQGTKATKVIL